MSGINEEIVDELLDALDMAMPDAPEADVGAAEAAAAATFADVVQATFQWNAAEAASNMQLFFPHWKTHGPAVRQGLAGTAGIPCHPTPFAGQQQQQQQQVLLRNPSPLPMAGAACSLHGSHVAMPSPFAGINASILRQPVAPVAAPPAAAQVAAPVTVAAACSTPLCAAARDRKERHQHQQHDEQQQEQHEEEQELHRQQQRATKRGRPQKVAGLYSKGYSTILKYRQRKKDMVRNSCC
jgi:Ni/Co efflux regulator RcnB